MTLLLLVGMAAAPWAAEPGHLRAAAEPPADLRALSQPRAVRVYWDDTGAPLEVQAALGGRWRTVEEAALPGVRTPPLPPGTLLRVVDAGGQPSAAFSPTWALDPATLARLAAPTALPGREVAELEPTPEGAWAALLEGGLAWVHKQHLEAQPLGLAEGLPHPQVNTVALLGEDLYIGTPAGLARVRGGQVDRVWDAQDGLPDPWVQALAPAEGGGLWVGTYRGLARLEGETLARVLGPWSVFSLTRGPDARDWVGYEGLRGLPDGEPIEGVDPALNVWDVEVRQPRVYLATDREGLLVLEEGFVRAWWAPAGGAVYALERLDGALWAAGGEAGLVQVDEQDGRALPWPGALPRAAVTTLALGPPGRLWVGGDRGLALTWPERGVAVPWPLSPLSAGLGVGAVVGDTRWVVLGTDEGLVPLGRVPRAWRHLEGPSGPVLALAQQGRTLWVVGEDAVWRLRRQDTRRWPLPSPAGCGAFAGGSLWVGTAQGLLRLDLGADTLVATEVGGAVQALAADPGGFVWVASHDRVIAVDAAGGRRDYLRTQPPSALAVVPGGVLVGSQRGVERLDPHSGDTQELPVAGPVLALAAGAGQAWAWTGDQGLVDVGTGAPAQGMPPLEPLGAPRGAAVDGQGRVWLWGGSGAVVMER